MAIGTYSTTRPAAVDLNDIEIFYTYAPDRSTKPSDVMKLDATRVMESVKDPDAANGNIALGGLYHITLPANIFNRKGIYTVAIRPKRIFGVIRDCGVLSSLPDVRGLVIDPNEFFEADKSTPITGNPSKTKKGGLVGYRVEYLNYDTNGNKQLRTDNFTIVTWSNACEAVANNTGNSTQKSKAYRLTDSNSGLMFLTVTPSTSPSIRANQRPEIGVAGEEIILTNPYFDPYYFEVELTEYDMDSLAIALYGDQTRSIDDGIVTWYKNVNGKKEIYKQHVMKEMKDEYNETLLEIKENLEVLDDSKEWDDLMSDSE
jgi:hypothetical protein